MCVFLSLVIVLGILPARRIQATSDVLPIAGMDTPVAEELQRMINTLGGQYRFDNFLADRADVIRPGAEYIINGTDYSFTEGMEVRVYENFEDMPGASLWTCEEGLVEWEVYVSQGGLYHMSVKYYPVQGRNSEIQRSVIINGEVPYFEAAAVNFHRTWVNQFDYILQDSRGNDLRPTQVEKRYWREVVIRDAMGEHNEYLSFYLQAGRNTIAFLSQREPMLIQSIRIFQRPDVLSYADVSAGFAGLNRPSIEPIRIEGQDAVRRSSAMLAPRANTAGPGVLPYSPRYIRINYIGGYAWSQPGSWIEWEVNVPESGLYKIALNVQQNFNRGAMAYRRISINGEIPFAEAAEIPFNFGSRWRVETLGNEDGYFLFYLQEGVNTIRMEAILGGYAPLLREVQVSVMNLNRIYRQIVMITGVTPDVLRDYQVGRRIPDLEENLRYERDRLLRVFEGLRELSGGNVSERDVIVRTVATVMDNLLRDTDDIPRRLGEFRINLGGLATWLTLVREQRLSVDAIYILAADAPTPTNASGFFAQLRHEVVSLVLSFFVDFYDLGDIGQGDAGRRIEVWMGSGRDQAVILRSMIDESFTRETGIAVDLKLVDMSMLLPATVSRQGPDVALEQSMDVPMNFAFRGAVADISGFPGFDEVVGRFSEAAMVPFTYGGQAFALPETLAFNMLFYRRDVLHELGIEPPDTWDDIRAAIAVLDHHHMDFGIHVSELNDPMMSFSMFLFQNGGDVYNPDGRFSGLDSPVALTAFRDFTRFYMDYRLPREFNFVNRFRNGDMPMAISNYVNFNTLQVFAPEIRGMWGFRPVPGTLQPDGTICRATPSFGNAVMMMEQANDKDSAWEFMKWWTSADTQAQFGERMESIMGPAARHPTANLEAFGRLPWSAQEYRSLSAQFEHVRGIPQVPGGYFTPRYVRNAFFTVVEQETIEARDALRNAVRLINDEINIKRREFGLE